MAHRLQTQPQNLSHSASPPTPSPTDNKADYDDLFDEYAADYNKNQSHQTFTIQSPTLAYASTPQHRRGPSFPLNNQSQSSISHKPEDSSFGAAVDWGYPPSSSIPAGEKERSRPFWQKVPFTYPKDAQWP